MKTLQNIELLPLATVEAVDMDDLCLGRTSLDFGD
jgi:hypothetical protein